MIRINVFNDFTLMKVKQQLLEEMMLDAIVSRRIRSKNKQSIFNQFSSKDWICKHLFSNHVIHKNVLYPYQNENDGLKVLDIIDKVYESVKACSENSNDFDDLVTQVIVVDMGRVNEMHAVNFINLIENEVYPLISAKPMDLSLNILLNKNVFDSFVTQLIEATEPQANQNNATNPAKPIPFYSGITIDTHYFIGESNDYFHVIKSGFSLDQPQEHLPMYMIIEKESGATAGGKLLIGEDKQKYDSYMYHGILNQTLINLKNNQNSLNLFEGREDNEGNKDSEDNKGSNHLIQDIDGSYYGGLNLSYSDDNDAGPFSEFEGYEPDNNEPDESIDESNLFDFTDEEFEEALADFELPEDKAGTTSDQCIANPLPHLDYGLDLTLEEAEEMMAANLKGAYENTEGFDHTEGEFSAKPEAESEPITESASEPININLIIDKIKSNEIDKADMIKMHLAITNNILDSEIADDKVVKMATKDLFKASLALSNEIMRRMLMGEE